MVKHTSEGLLWFGALGGPIAWAARLMISYALVPVACRVESLAPLWIVSGVTAAIALMAAVAGEWSRRRVTGDDARAERQRVMGRVGFWLGLLFAGVIAAESASLLFVDPCLDTELQSRLSWTAQALSGLLTGQFPNAALAHVIDPIPSPSEALGRWNLDPWIVLALAFAVSTHLRGVHRAWRRAGRGRSVSGGEAVSVVAGLAVLALALLSPIDTLGGLLFSAHMLQHLLLVGVAAPLIAFGIPWRAISWNVPPERLRRVVRGVKGVRGVKRGIRVARAGVTVFLLHLIAVWAWHLPSLYEAALQSEALHALEHASFFGTSVLFFGYVRRAGAGRGGRTGAGLLILFVTAAAMGVLGALMTLSPVPWYPPHAAGSEGWSISALEDQQLAGLLMWIPGAASYLAAAAWLTLRALSRTTLAPATAPPFPFASGESISSGAGLRQAQAERLSRVQGWPLPVRGEPLPVRGEPVEPPSIDPPGDSP